MPIITNRMLESINSWSPAMYKGETVTTDSYTELQELLCSDDPYQKGFEPGTVAYVSKEYKSAFKFLRNKAVTEDFYHLYTKGDSLLGLNPNYCGKHQIKEGDILISKDSNIGQVAIVPKGDWQGTYYSGGLIKLNITKDKLYTLGFLQTNLFRAQIDGCTPKGATIRHAGNRWLKAKIPFPQQNDNKHLKEIISNLVEQATHAEQCLINKAATVKNLVDLEIRSNQLTNNDISKATKLDSIISSGRLDAAFHSLKCRQLLHLAANYKEGAISPSEAGFEVIPGPTLEIKIIKQRVDSDTYVEGYYELFLPKNISEYGCMLKTTYLGTPAKLPYLEAGDVLVGEAGFRKGRSYIYVGDSNNATTNAHGLIIRRQNKCLTESAYFRAVIDWYRETGLFDLLAVGGSGGHLSPSYFPLLQLPKFKKAFKNKLRDLHFYSDEFETKAAKPNEATQTEIFNWQEKLGIELLAQIKAKRQLLLDRVYTEICDGKTIDVSKLKNDAYDILTTPAEFKNKLSQSKSLTI